MKLFIKKSIVLTLFLFFSSLQLHAEKESNTMDTVLQMGKQMSSLINMLETYTLIGLNVSYKIPTQRLKESITAYDMMLINLQTQYSDERIQKSVNIINESWKRIRRALYGVMVLQDKKTMRINAVYINEKLRLAIDELTKLKSLLLERVEEQDKSLLNAAIQLGVSAKRLSSNYMMKLWDVDDPNIKKYWTKNLKEFSSALQLLRSSSLGKSKAMQKDLVACKRTFDYFSLIFEMKIKAPVLVHKKVSFVVERSNKFIEELLGNIKG